MTLPFHKDKLKPLTVFLNLCKQNPDILHNTDLEFIKSFIEHFGGTIPAQKPKTEEEPSAGETPKSEQKEPETKPKAEPEAEPEPEVESEESDIELDMTGVIEPDNDSPQKMGNPTLEPTEEEIAESQAKRSEAVSAFVEKDYEKAIALYTDAIVLNPQAALLYAKRGQVYLLMQKPNACIRDCDRALELNPDSAAAHKFRGRAYHLLGRFDDAAADLRLACKFDFDEQADEWLREVTPNARKIEEHKRKKERKALEKAERERIAALQKAREEAKAREDNTRPSQTEGSADGAPGMDDFYKYLKDPEIVQALADQEVAQAFIDISDNPANIVKYQNNPKVMNLINKAASKFGGVGGAAGGMADGFPGMMGGMPGGGFFPGAGTASQQPPTDGPKPSAPSPDDDVGLD